MVDLSAQTVLEVQDKSEKEAENPRVSSVEVFPRERDGSPPSCPSAPSINVEWSETEAFAATRPPREESSVTESPESS